MMTTIHGAGTAIEAGPIVGQCSQVIPSAMTLVGGLEVSPRAARAHEMKNCMSVILAVSRLVEHELSEESRVRMGRLQAALWRLNALVKEDLSDLATASFRRAPSGPLSVTALVEETVDRLADRAAAVNVEVFVQCGGGQLECDEGALREALFNVLANAIEASPRGGAVFVATYLTSDGDQCWMVQDTGAGMPAEHLAALGRPFRSTKAGGSGLGFAIARGAVAAHGGLIHVESHANAGTTVSMWLPRRPCSPMAQGRG